ncbi:MAG: acyl carrier protein [candidate division SR1 bacterium]|nr:acyl carrier protein [candidate division SR1 bacterium]
MASRTEITKWVTEKLVEKLKVEKKAVVPTAHLKNDLGGDSLDQVEMVMECEKKYGIKIPDLEAEKLNTVEEIIDYIEQNQN